LGVVLAGMTGLVQMLSALLFAIVLGGVAMRWKLLGGVGNAWRT
jgi:hypothetical protein